jgi:FkbM family methyltransferase
MDDIVLYNTDGGDVKLRFNHEELNTNSIVFDVGGYLGTWSEVIYSKYGSNVYIFEPVNNFFDIINRKFHNYEKIKVYNFGLSNKTSKEYMYFDDNGSSLYNKSNSKLQIDLVSMFDFMINNNIEKIDLLKLNVEGEEYNIMYHLIENKLINKINKFQIQYHKFVEDFDKKREYISNFLLNNNYIRVYNYNYVWEEWIKK